MKNTGMILLGTALAIGGLALARKLKPQDKQKIKDFVRKKLSATTGLALQKSGNAQN